jgi:hypothetical protein
LKSVVAALDLADLADRQAAAVAADSGLAPI